MKAPATQDRSDSRSSVEELRAEYPVLHQALGDERFERFVSGLGEAGFAVDLARLERCFNEVFFLPDPGRESVGPDGLRELSADDLIHARFALAGSSRLLALRYPLVEYFEAVRAGLGPHTPGPAESFALLLRGRDRVLLHRISRPEFVVLGLLKRGETLDDALAVVDPGDGTHEPLGMSPSRWARLWAARGLFRSIAL